MQVLRAPFLAMTATLFFAAACGGDDDAEPAFVTITPSPIVATPKVAATSTPDAPVEPTLQEYDVPAGRARTTSRRRRMAQSGTRRRAAANSESSIPRRARRGTSRSVLARRRTV